MTVGPLRLADAPSELPVALDPAVRVLAGGRVLVGGSPPRLVALTARGACLITRWKDPGAVGCDPAERRLARRLLDAGLLAPHPRRLGSTSGMTVVIPVRDRAAQLARCLDSVLTTCPGSPVVVVDDGSVDPLSVHAVCAKRGVRLVRHRESRGPAAARNRGLAASSTPFVGFIDSDVVLPAGSSLRLLGHLSDPCVAAVAPRVRALVPGRGVIGGYEQRHSALDMGGLGGVVAPGRPTSYVPSTVLFARRCAMGSGFDESLSIGEDVDLVWRLSRSGWRVRYVPEVEVWHEHRVRARAFISTRRRYARSIGMLSRRHPRGLAAMWVSPVPVLPWILLLAGRQRAALVAAMALVGRTRRKMRGLPVSTYPLACVIVLRGLADTGKALAHAARRAWAPPLVLSGVRGRRFLLAAFAIRMAEDAVAAGALRAALADVPVRLLDELVAGAGTWEGCLRERTIRPLLPSWRPPE